MKEETKKLLDEAAQQKRKMNWYAWCAKVFSFYFGESALDDIIETAIEKAVEDAKPKWISVEERLPEWGERVLVYDTKIGVQIAYLNLSKEWRWYRIFAPTEITHWQPLPETDKL